MKNWGGKLEKKKKKLHIWWNSFLSVEESSVKDLETFTSFPKISGRIGRIFFCANFFMCIFLWWTARKKIKTRTAHFPPSWMRKRTWKVVQAGQNRPHTRSTGSGSRGPGGRQSGRGTGYPCRKKTMTGIWSPHPPRGHNNWHRTFIQLVQRFFCVYFSCQTDEFSIPRVILVQSQCVQSQEYIVQSQCVNISWQTTPKMISLPPAGCWQRVRWACKYGQVPGEWKLGVHHGYGLMCLIQTHLQHNLLSFWKNPTPPPH